MRLTIIILTVFMINTTILKASEAEEKKIADTHAKVMLKYKIRFIKGKIKILTEMRKEYEAQISAEMAKGDMDATMKTKEKVEDVNEQLKDLAEDLGDAKEDLAEFTDSDY